MRVKGVMLFLLALLLVAAFAGNAPVANAATSQTVNMDQVVARLNAIGLVQGYPDGTFGLDKNITRAEFAAIVCRALGMESAAQSAKGATQFSDVPASHWASGYINLASGKGIIKGYPDGTFKPDANVNYAEAATMLVRALGYEPAVGAAGGTWPSNYLGKAGEKGILDDVSFISWDNAAVRGDVFLMLDNSLDVDLMEQTGYGTDITYEEKDGENILNQYLDITVIDEDNYKDYTTDEEQLRVGNVPRTDMDTLDPDEIRFDNYRAGSTFKVAPGINPNEWLGYSVEAWIKDQTHGDDLVLYLEPSEDQQVLKDVIDSDISAYAGKQQIDLEKAGKVYDVLDSATIYLNNKEYAVDDFFALGDQLEDAMVTAVLNDDDEVTFLDVFDYADLDDPDDNMEIWLVKDVDAQAELVEYYDETGAENEEDLSGLDYVVIRNGQVAGLEDIKPFDVVNAINNNDQWLLVATDKRVSGTGGVAQGSNIYGYDIFVDGKKYDVDYALTFSDDDNDSIDKPSTSDLDDLTDENITIYLDNRGWVRHVVTGAAVAGKGDMAVVSETPVKEYTGKDYTLALMNEQGQEMSFTFDPADVDFYINKGGTKTLVGEDDFVKVLEDYKDGTIGNVTVQGVPGITLALTPDNFVVPVEYKVNSRGELTQLYLRNDLQANLVSEDDGTLDLDEDDDQATFDDGNDPGTFRGTDKTVVFDLTDKTEESSAGGATVYNLDDPKVTNWDGVKSKDHVELYYSTDDDEIDYLFVTAVQGSLGSEGNYAVVKNLTVKNGDDALDLVTADGSRKTYVIDTGSAKKADFIYYEINADDEIKVIPIISGNKRDKAPVDVAVYDADDAEEVALDRLALFEVDSASSRSIEATAESGGGYYVVNDKTVYYDIHSMGTIGKVNGVSKGDFVLAVDTDDDGGAYDYVVILHDYSDRPSGTTGEDAIDDLGFQPGRFYIGTGTWELLGD